DEELEEVLCMSDLVANIACDDVERHSTLKVRQGDGTRIATLTKPIAAIRLHVVRGHRHCRSGHSVACLAAVGRRSLMRRRGSCWLSSGRPNSRWAAILRHPGDAFRFERSLDLLQRFYRRVLPVLVTVNRLGRQAGSPGEF